MIKVKAKKVKPRRAVFFDRDGVINGSPGEGSYVLSWWDFQFEPGSVEVLTWLKKQGYFLVLVTNQQCVGRGLITPEQLDAIHDRSRARRRRKKINAPRRVISRWNSSAASRDCAKFSRPTPRLRSKATPPR